MNALVETSTDTDATEKPTATTHLVLTTANAIQDGTETGDHVKVRMTEQISKI